MEKEEDAENGDVKCERKKEAEEELNSRAVGRKFHLEEEIYLSCKMLRGIKKRPKETNRRTRR